MDKDEDNKCKWRGTRNARNKNNNMLSIQAA